MHLLSHLFYIVPRSGMGCVIMYLSMLSGFKPNQYAGNKKKKIIYLHVLIKLLLIKTYGEKMKSYQQT